MLKKTILETYFIAFIVVVIHLNIISKSVMGFLFLFLFFFFPLSKITEDEKCQIPEASDVGGKCSNIFSI